MNATLKQIEERQARFFGMLLDVQPSATAEGCQLRHSWSSANYPTR